MKKETIFAIILGVLTGVIMAVLIIVNSNKNTFFTPDTTLTNPSISPSIKFNTKKINPLLITNPANNVIFNHAKIKITGTCSKNAFLLLQSDSTEIALKTSASTFSIPYTLKTGENTIKITQYVDKTSDSREITIYYNPD